MVTTYGSLIVILRRQWVIRIVSVIEQTPTKDACLPLPEMVWETVPYSPVLHPVPERLKANIGVPCEILDDLVLVPPIWNVNSQQYTSQHPSQSRLADVPSPVPIFQHLREVPMIHYIFLSASPKQVRAQGEGLTGHKRRDAIRQQLVNQVVVVCQASKRVS
jgi:hypothetical protein